MSTIVGKPITLGGGGKLPDIFGDGSDGDLVIKAGETVTLEVPVPHQSVIEKNYASITIEAGGTLTTSDYNAGLVLRCQGDCVIHGTIDQSGKAPKTNPDSTYQYPEELVCGDGGMGGKAYNYTAQATAMPGRPYGGGYGSGGKGGTYRNWNNSDSEYVYIEAGNGGSTDGITIDTVNFFIGGTARRGAGTNGGGGGGWADLGGVGGSGPGGTGGNATATASDDYGTGGGGAGNTGGGVLMLYVGGNVSIDGNINCNGLNGGNGGNAKVDRDVNCGAGGGAGGGGGGGGSIYIVHNGTQTITGNLNVNGGVGGSPGASYQYWGTGGIVSGGPGSSSGESGGIGTTTIKQYEKGMTA